MSSVFITRSFSLQIGHFVVLSEVNPPRDPLNSEKGFSAVINALKKPFALIWHFAQIK